MTDPRQDNALQAMIRGVVQQELHRFAVDMGNELEHSLTVAFEPCLQALQQLSRDQGYMADTIVALTDAFTDMRKSVAGLSHDMADDWWKGEPDADAEPDNYGS